MARNTVNQVFDQVRGILSDTQVPSGEIFTNAYLPPHFAEPYRSMFARLAGASKRIQRVIGVVLPANTTALIPWTYAITDLSDPEMVEERLAPNSIAISTTDTSTPIVVTTASPHGYTIGSMNEGVVSGVNGTSAPWGNWFATATGANTMTLNGSASDGNAGTGGAFYPENNQQFTEVQPIDLTAAGLDGPPQGTLGSYLWINEMFQFRGCVNAVQLRITYYASGTPPTNPNFIIPIDNAIDFLATATAANAARSKNWDSKYETLRNQAYGDPSHPDEPSLLDLFWLSQVMSMQRGPARRQLPFRDKRFRFGSYMIG